MKLASKKIILFIILSVSCALLLGCSKEGEILGRWEYVVHISYFPGGIGSGNGKKEGDVVQYYEFYSGGKGIRGQSSPTKGYSTYQRTMRWEKEGDSIIIDGKEQGRITGAYLVIAGAKFSHVSW